MIDSVKHLEDGTTASELEQLVELARLSPSTHNSQPWRFRVGAGRIDVFADERRWLSVADADRRELHLSLGCAVETLAVAADHMGWHARVELFPRPGRDTLAASIRLHRRTGEAAAYAPLLFHAIARRQTHRGDYDEYPVSGAVLEQLRDCVDDEGVALFATRERAALTRIGQLVERAEHTVLADPAYRDEMAESLERGGVGPLGAPLPLRAFARFALRHLDIAGRVARRERARLDSSGAVAVLVTLTDDPESRVRAGQAMQRVWLLGTALGLAMQPISAPLRVPRLRRALGEVIGAHHMCPQILVRLGHAGPALGRPPRLEREAILTA